MTDRDQPMTTVCIPGFDPRPVPGCSVEVWTLLTAPDAEARTISAAREWSRYLLGYCGLQLAEGGVVGESIRDGEQVVLLTTVLA